MFWSPHAHLGNDKTEINKKNAEIMFIKPITVGLLDWQRGRSEYGWEQLPPKRHQGNTFRGRVGSNLLIIIRNNNPRHWRSNFEVGPVPIFPFYRNFYSPCCLLDESTPLSNINTFRKTWLNRWQRGLYFGGVRFGRTKHVLGWLKVGYVFGQARVGAFLYVFGQVRVGAFSRWPAGDI